MIPKKIHYCWFGRGELSAKAQTCIASWKKYCPDFEIKEWNEDNFDIHRNAYTEMCYVNRKFAFLSDYARLVIIADEGGIYFDVDVEVVRPLDPLLKHPAFLGFETEEYVNTGMGFGAEAQNPAVLSMLSAYDTLLDGEHGTVGCPILNTQGLDEQGLVRNGTYQDLGTAVVYPPTYFNPYEDATGRLRTTKDTYSIHWYAKSWMSRWQILRSTLSKPLHRLMAGRR
jgi:hypothetical protein